MLTCCTSCKSVINLTYSEQLQFSHTALMTNACYHHASSKTETLNSIWSQSRNGFPVFTKCLNIFLCHFLPVAEWQPESNP